MNIIFFGTNDFALPALQPLAENFNIVLVVTKPAKPVGRKQIISPTPIEAKAKQLGLNIIAPENFGSETISQIKKLAPDLFVVVDYGKIIPQEILDIPARGAINIHPSALPKYRGASPLQSAILNGEKETAISIMLIDKEMDHGPILMQKKVIILPNDTYGSLYTRLSQEYPELLIDTIKKYLSDKITPQEQNHTKATFTKLLKREDGKIDWTKPASEIERMIRAYDPWPGAFCEYTGKRVKILKASMPPKNYPDKHPGQFFKTPSGGLATGCGQNTTLLIHNLQPESKKPITGEEFVKGYVKESYN
ncbi:methionyl-tRNA formyltransferase [Patescibacteria group bacterium]|nr:methionyl-tRNA formyltransferase [Patescibacteria group bacterium]